MNQIDESEFIRRLEEMLELKAGSLSTGNQLREISSWDSLAVMSFIALLDGTYGISVPASRIPSCRTVGDLLILARGGDA